MILPAVQGATYVLGNVDYRLLLRIVQTDDFVAYVKSLKKYKSGGYYTFNARELEQYINYQLSYCYDKTGHKLSIDKRRVYQSNLELFR